jgi:hypothetical protein
MVWKLAALLAALVMIAPGIPGADAAAGTADDTAAEGAAATDAAASPTAADAATGMAAGKADGTAAENPGELVRVRGKVRLVGSMPYPDTVITDGENRNWYLERQEAKLLRDRVEREVTLEGRAEIVNLTLFNGKPAGVRYILHGIRIIQDSKGSL